MTVFQLTGVSKVSKNAKIHVNVFSETDGYEHKQKEEGFKKTFLLHLPPLLLKPPTYLSAVQLDCAADKHKQTKQKQQDRPKRRRGAVIAPSFPAGTKQREKDGEGCWGRRGRE